MAIYQIFVKLLDGRTRCVHVSSPTISGHSLKQSLRTSTKIPIQSLRLVSGRHEISDETLISASADGDGGRLLFPSFTLLLRLRGGKGGFGSLLRGAATKAGQKKTNNFDACRDMSGRRLRHVNAEKKLEEWMADAEERKLEKIAENFLKKKAKEVKKTGGSGDAEKYVNKYREDSDKCMEEVDASVRESFGLYENAKRKVLPSSGHGAAKRLKIWLGKGKAVESDSDGDEDDEEENEKSVVLDDCIRSQGDEGNSSSVSAGLSDGDSSGGGSPESNMEEENGNCHQGGQELGEGSGSGNSDTDAYGPVGPELGVCDQGDSEFGEGSGSDAVNVDVEGCASEDNNAEIETSGSKAVHTERESSVETSPGIHEGAAVLGASISEVEGPLNFDEFNSAAEMEVLGMERLKTELQARGLKCGGTLQERSARLFLLKTTPVDMLPKKLLAKPSK